MWRAACGAASRGRVLKRPRKVCVPRRSLSSQGKVFLQRLAKRLTVWVGLPVEYHDLYAEYFDCLRDQVTVRFFATEVEQGDRFFVKFGLLGLLERLAPEDQFLYLDYDHLVLGPLQLEATPAHCICVSSEVKQYGAKLSLVGADVMDAIPVGERVHYNNSLMFSSVATMRQMAGTHSDVRQIAETHSD